MKGFSNVSLSGNLTKDPFVGQGYVKFTVAIESVYKSNQGFQKMTNFIPVVVFGGLSETAQKLTKGDYVIVRGEMRSKITEDKHLLINVSANKIMKITLTDGSKQQNGYKQNANNQSYNNGYNQNQQNYSRQAPQNAPNNNYKNPYNEQAPQRKQNNEDISFNEDSDFDSIDPSDTIPF